MPPSYSRKQINVCRICKINFIVLISRLYSGTSIYIYLHLLLIIIPCLLVKAGRAFDPKIQKISYIYKLNINISSIVRYGLF